MDWTNFVLVAGALTGQICHIVKKKAEGGEDELQVFRRWVLKRPFNTMASVAVSITAAYALQVVDMTLAQVFFTSFVTGIAANSVVNRPQLGQAK